MAAIGDLIVRTGGLTFRGQPGPRRELGFIIEPGGAKGLTGGGVGVSRSKAARSGAHGTFAARGWRDGRTITLSGEAVAESPTGRAKLADQLGGLMADGLDETIEADLEDGTTRSYVGGLATSPDWVENPDGRSARFQVQIWCPDVYSYGERRVFTQASPGVLEVFQRGNQPARPVVKMTATAAMAGYQLKIFHPNGTQLGNLRMHAIANGHTVAVDMASGRVTLNGAPTGQLVYSGNVWRIPPGGVYRVMLEKDGEIGQGRLEVTVPDTFI
ncbi:hypothetical protein [Pseudoclavibacter sp. RFBA6]|uniref:hypothetical protein n=1 Tax=Pseudoclavibacter sp. RFBA6 TaxID=2080573 RepID=UPI000CE8FAF0|nr:hypothetical protein [Pseudoclavibacter sp. RFBA6]PPG39470.1 hypothetical protein C5C17_11815 [Pseudoclavibacter sp. RFBA6]